MPRRRVAAKREVLPDPLYKSQTITRFVNVVMMDGKKSTAEKIVYGALQAAAEQIMKQHSDEDGDSGETGTGTSALHARILKIFDKVLTNIRPAVEVRSRRVGGATYQVPCEVRPERAETLAMRWLKDAARGRSEKGMVLRLKGEMIDAYENRGSAVKKREDTHRMADANKAFAHFRWN